MSLFPVYNVDKRNAVTVIIVMIWCMDGLSWLADVILSPWPDEAHSSGVKVRNISYTLTLTNPLGPKTSPSTERQVGVLSLFDATAVYFLYAFLISA